LKTAPPSPSGGRSHFSDADQGAAYTNRLCSTTDRRHDHRHLHTGADAEIRHFPLARELRRADFSLTAALAEAAGTRMHAKCGIAASGLVIASDAT
jgi:hypothetical protein